MTAVGNPAQEVVTEVRRSFDTSGPAIAISVKVMAVVSLVIAPWLGALGREGGLPSTSICPEGPWDC